MDANTPSTSTDSTAASARSRFTCWLVRSTANPPTSSHTWVGATPSAVATVAGSRPSFTSTTYDLSYSACFRRRHRRQQAGEPRPRPPRFPASFRPLSSPAVRRPTPSNPWGGSVGGCDSPTRLGRHSSAMSLLAPTRRQPCAHFGTHDLGGRAVGRCGVRGPVHRRVRLLARVRSDPGEPGARSMKAERALPTSQPRNLT